MITIEKQSKIPIYEQIIDCIEKDIISGIIMPDELIPSVRTLSVELSTNPNTIQKAYTELERNGITYSVPGVGRYVSKNAMEIIKAKMIDSQSSLFESVKTLKLAGVSLDEIISMVKKIYEKENK